MPMISFPFLVTFQELFIYTALIKVILQRKRQSAFIYKKPVNALILFGIFLFFITFFMGTSVRSIFESIKWTLSWTLLYSIPKLITTKEDWICFFRLIFPVTFIALAAQLFQLSTGQTPSSFLGADYLQVTADRLVNIPSIDPEIYLNSAGRPISCSSMLLINLITGLFFLTYKKPLFNRNYLTAVVTGSFASIILTGTRGWMIAFSIVLIIYFVFINRSYRVVSRIFLITILGVIIVLSSQMITNQLIGVTKRLSTVEAIARGDLTAEGTLARLDKYTPQLLKVWEGSPVVGWAFSDTFKENSNGHAGLANLLMQVGILGYLIFIYFWYQLINTPLRVNKYLSKSNPYKKSLLVFILAFVIFFVLHSSSGQQFGYSIGFLGGTFSQFYFYCFSSVFILDALNVEMKIRKANAENINGQNN
jgi:hypothetical protein